MSRFAVRQSSWKALATAGAMLVVALGVHAATPAQEPVQVHVAGQLPLHEACPAIDADLPAALAAAWDDAAKPSAVLVTFKVQRHAVFDVVPRSASPRMFHQIRRAVRGLSCSSGDDQPHAVRMLVLFVYGTDGRRVATMDNVDVDVDVASAR